ncbi:MAG: DUF4338 domain-containing protein [Desulfobacterales bacterium]|nr:DUF4338 domain-containing protein [Desulfobacterales bacterium]
MLPILVYRGRPVTKEDIAFIRNLIANQPQDGRYALSRQICYAWNWVQPNGHIKDMVCRGLLLQLEKEGYIVLPPRKSTPRNPFLHRKPPEPVLVDESPLERSIKELFPITLQQVRRTPFEKLFNGLIAQYHYLGYTQPVGEHLKYLVFSHDRPIACLAWSSAPWHLGCRDRFIGWSPAVRKKNLHLLAYNSRFLILNWMRVPHLASHLLAKSAKVLSSDWQRIYHHPLYWLETFVDTERFKGTCYQAANWILLGKTTGRGKNDQTNKVNRSIKYVYGYPLTRDFRARLGVAQ